MTSSWPLSKDSFSVKVDNTDDVMASHINNPQDSIVALEDLRDYSLIRVKNTSGSTVAANDVGYIDAAGEFKLTTTVYLSASWCVVVAGAANNADIIVTNKGRANIILNGNCSIGDYLYTSSTTKQAQPETYMRPELLAVAQTANASGAGGTCEAMLFCGSALIPTTDADTIYRTAVCNDSDFNGTIATLPGGAVLTYNIVSGDELVLDAFNATQLAKLRLYNSTRSTYALISDTVTGTNTITLTANVPAGWIVGDSITVRSQTNTNVSGASRFLDYEVTDVAISDLARGIVAEVTWYDSGAVGERLILHPWEAFAAGKRAMLDTTVAGTSVYGTKMIPLIQRRYTAQWTASGAGTALCIVALAGVILATA